MLNLKIDTIQIRLRNISPEIAQNAIDGLEKELQAHLRSGALLQAADSTKVLGTVTAPVVRLDGNSTASHARRSICRAIVDSMVSGAATNSKGRD